ncbi:MAG: acetyl-CoA carboxylase biotin carboxylase subunit, partial [Gemmatimonadetes bacterium]|nr:acetyl-CoA carboxylase biotin carboxylase subunit [Gemmatimonadota bacterium]
VQWQIRIASGEPLAFAQEDIRWEGHAIECRITSEDPANSFLPSTGRIQALELPSGPGVRWDGGIAAGYEVTLFYDPMLAKLIVHAPTRSEAIARMWRALSELRVVGVDTSALFHLRVMDEPDFIAGNLNIRYLETHEGDLLDRPLDDGVVRVAALAAALLEEEAKSRGTVLRAPGAIATGSAWTGRGSWSGR